VRLAVAQKPSAPPELLVRLVGPGGMVRWGVARNPSAPPEALARLAADIYARTRRRVAQNASALLEDIAAVTTSVVIRQLLRRWRGR
jgi:hypothetical protein